MTWQIFAVLTMVFFALISFFIKLGAGSTDGRLAALVLNATAVMLLIVLTLVMKVPISFTGKSAFFILAAGACAAIGNVFAFKTFSLGAPISVTAPMFAVGAVLIGYTLGLTVFKESFSYTSLFGVLLGLVSIWLVFK